MLCKPPDAARRRSKHLVLEACGLLAQGLFSEGFLNVLFACIWVARTGPESGLWLCWTVLEQKVTATSGEVTAWAVLVGKERVKGKGESSASVRASAKLERGKTCCFLKTSLSVAVLNSNALPSSRLFLMLVEYRCACRTREGRAGERKSDLGRGKKTSTGSQQLKQGQGILLPPFCGQ